MSAGFYKYEDGVWLYAPNTVINANYQLIASDRDTYDLPIDGWDWYNISPENALQEEVEELRRKKEFGQTAILEFMVETKVEGIFMTNPQLAQQSIVLTQGLVDSLDKGWLLLAINQIKSIPQNSLNSIITSDILLKYRNNIHIFLNIPVVQNYYD